jgi:hypothetical protein
MSSVHFILALVTAVLLHGCGPALDVSTLTVDSQGYVTRADAQRVLLNCPVKSVTQSHSQVVGIELHDGSRIQSREPSIEAAWQLIKQHGLEKQISYVTE